MIMNSSVESEQIQLIPSDQHPLSTETSTSTSVETGSVFVESAQAAEVQQNGEQFVQENANKETVIRLFHDGKAGLPTQLDSKKINEILNEHSRGSRFYNHKLAKQQKIDKQVESMKLQLAACTEQELQFARKEVERLKGEFRAQSQDLVHIRVHIDMDMFFAGQLACEMQSALFLRLSN